MQCAFELGSSKQSADEDEGHFGGHSLFNLIHMTDESSILRVWSLLTSRLVVAQTRLLTRELSTRGQA